MKTNLLFGMFVVATLGFVASNVQAQDASATNEEAPAVVQEEIAEVEETPLVGEAENADVLYGVQKLDQAGDLAEAASEPQAIAQSGVSTVALATANAVGKLDGAAQVYGPCEECYDLGVRGFGFGRIAERGISVPTRSGRFAGRFGNRQIVAASPYANPTGAAQDWARFRNYPYGYYPHNFGAPDMSVPKYNPRWQNFYPNARRFHEGKHFILDVF